MKKLSIFLCLLGVLLVSCNHNRIVVTKVESAQDVAVLCGGYISDYENFSNAHHGICWSESPDPTLKKGNVAETGFRTNKKGEFSIWIRDLLPEHTYYFRAFYADGQTITYGSVICVTTKATYHDNTFIENAVQDYDGNAYNATKLGDQTWMASNLKTTHYADGVDVTFTYPDGNQDNVNQYGYLYSFKTATRGAYSEENPNPSGVQGICPNGWHLPSLAEWDQLKYYLESHEDQYIKPSGSIAKALASTEGWMASTGYGAPGNDPSTNNSTGFSAMPAGVSRGHDIVDFQQSAYFAATNTLNFWLDNQYCTASSYASLSHNSSGFFNEMLQSASHGWRYSVRCVKD